MIDSESYSYTRSIQLYSVSDDEKIFCLSSKSKNRIEKNKKA